MAGQRCHSGLAKRITDKGLIPTGTIESITKTVLKDTSITVAVTYKQISNSYNAAKAENVLTPSNTNTRAVFALYNKWEVINSNGAILEGDARFFIHASELSSITPAQGDRINYDGSDWEVLSLEMVPIGATKILFEFHCRR